MVLNAITELQKNGRNMSFSFLNYAQLGQCKNWRDSWVSCKAGTVTVPWSSESSGVPSIYTYNRFVPRPSRTPSPYQDTVLVRILYCPRYLTKIPCCPAFWNFKLIELSSFLVGMVLPQFQVIKKCFIVEAVEGRLVLNILIKKDGGVKAQLWQTVFWK